MLGEEASHFGQQAGSKAERIAVSKASHGRRCCTCETTVCIPLEKMHMMTKKIFQQSVRKRPFSAKQVRHSRDSQVEVRLQP